MNIAILLLAVAQTALYTSLFYLFPATLLEWEATSGWSRTEITFAFTLAIAVSAIFSPMVGRLIDKGYGATVIAGSALLGGTLLWPMHSVSHLYQFYAIWFGIGIAMAGCLYNPLFSFLIRNRQQYAKRDITFISLVAGFASTICFPTTHYMLTHYDLATTLMFASILVIGFVPTIYFSCRYIQCHGTIPAEKEPEANSPQAAHLQPTMKAFFYSQTFWLLTISFALLGLCHSVIIAHLFPLLDERQLSPANATLIASLLGPMQVIGRVVSLYADRRFNIVAVTLGCFVGVNLALITLFFATDNMVLLALFILFQGSSFGVFSILKQLVVKELMGESQFGLISGYMALPYLLLSAAAPYLGAIIWEIGNYQTLLLLMILTGFSALFCFQRLHKNTGMRVVPV